MSVHRCPCCLQFYWLAYSVAWQCPHCCRQAHDPETGPAPGGAKGGEAALPQEREAADPEPLVGRSRESPAS